MRLVGAPENPRDIELNKALFSGKSHGHRCCGAPKRPATNFLLNVLLGVYIPQDWLSEAWQSIGGGRIVDIRYVDVHRVTAYLATYLAGDKVAHTLALLPVRARIFTTSRSIVLWGKKKVSGWWLRRKGLGELRDSVGLAYKERFEATEDLKAFDLEMLTYFEGPVSQNAIGNRNTIAVLKELLRFWKAETN